MAKNTPNHPARRPLIAGNWKMNLSSRESAELLRGILQGLPPTSSGPEVIVAPPFTALSLAAEILKGSQVRLAAQDAHWEASGAYTGEISPVHLKDVGCAAVILGHSERRRHFGDTDAVIHKKMTAAIKHQLIPIVCVGETLQERESSQTFQVLETQVKGVLEGFTAKDLALLVIAYEPVWAIGTGKTATPEQAQEAHHFIRQQVAKLYGEPFAQALRILYGGSVTPDNIDSLMAQSEVDGALVGGASLKAASFLQIVNFKVGTEPVAQTAIFNERRSR